MPVLKVFVLIFVALAVRPLAAQPGAGGFGGGYDGPSILGRTGPGAGQHGTETIPIHVQASINTNYDSSILGYTVDTNGQLKAKSSYGGDANINVSGRRRFRRSFFGIDYGGNYSRYATTSFANGTNQQLSLALGTQVGQKIQLVAQGGAGISNRFIGGPTVFQSSEFEFLSAPTQELFDARSYFLGITSGITYSMTRRSSIRFTGTGSTVRRRARSLVDMTSYGSSGDWVYRLSRRTSIGVSYNFNHFDFEKIFGDSDIHTIGAHVSRKIGRDWTFSAAATGSKQSTVGVRTVALDPVLVAILGRQTGSEVFETNNLVYGYTVSATRQIRRSTLSVGTIRGVNPGNGYFLTSINESTSASISHNVSRELALSASGSRNRMTSLGFASGAFSSWNGGGGVTYKLSPSFGINGRFDWRTFALQQTTFGRTGYHLSIGVSFFPDQGIAGLW